MISNFLFKSIIVNLFRFMTFLTLSKDKDSKTKKRSQNFHARFSAVSRTYKYKTVDRGVLQRIQFN